MDGRDGSLLPTPFVDPAVSYSSTLSSAASPSATSSATSNSSSVPRDVQDISTLLHNAAIPFTPQVLPILLQYYHTVTRQILTTLHDYQSYAQTRTTPSVDDVELVLSTLSANNASLSSVPPELLYELAQQRNNIPLPLLRVSAEPGEVILPPARYTLTQADWQYKPPDTDTNSNSKQKDSNNT